MFLNIKFFNIKFILQYLNDSDKISFIKQILYKCMIFSKNVKQMKRKIECSVLNICLNVSFFSICMSKCYLSISRTPSIGRTFALS